MKKLLLFTAIALAVLAATPITKAPEWPAFGEGQHIEHVATTFLTAQDPEQPSHDKEGHEDGAPGHGCHHKLDPALKKNSGAKACASSGECKTCERADDGTSFVSESTKCSSWCHKNCCHCPSPCDS